MSGAYVAKPAVSAALVEGVDVPAGWNVNWIFPGPCPPGYIPIYALDLTAPAIMVPGMEVGNITLNLIDHDTFVTGQPDGQIFWTAKWSDTKARVQLKLSEDANYQDTVTQNYSEGETYWGSEPTFLFDVSADDVGRVVILTAQSKPFTVFEIAEEAYVEIEVVIEAGEPYAILTLTMTGFQGRGPLHRNDDPEQAKLENIFGASLHFGNSIELHTTPYARVYHYFWNNRDSDIPPGWYPDDPKWYFAHGASPESSDEFEIRTPTADGQALAPYYDMVDENGVPYPKDWLIGECNGNQIVIKAVRFKPYWVLPWEPLTYSVQYSVYLNWSGGDVILDFSLKMYDSNGMLENTWTKQVTVECREGNLDWVPKVEWLTIDGATREVTVVNP